MKLKVKVVPGASRERMEWLGDTGNILKVRVTQPPEKGKANKAVARLIADSLNLSVTDVVIISGKTSQHKVAEITGLSDPEVFRLLNRIITQ